MARVKAKKTTTIKDWVAADDMVYEIGELQRRIGSIKNHQAEQIELITGTYENEIADIEARVAEKIADLELFAKSKPEDFKKKKSVQIDYSRLGWRKSTTISVSKKTISLIKRMYCNETIKKLIKAKETVRKGELAKLNDCKLKLIGCRRIKTETFFVESDEL